MTEVGSSEETSEMVAVPSVIQAILLDIRIECFVCVLPWSVCAIVMKPHRPSDFYNRN